jgi:hypothetical protein
MRNTISILSAITAFVAISIAACTDSAAEFKPVSKKQTARFDSAAMVQRGKYLVNAMGCDDCHSPKRMGPKGPELIPELRFSGFPHDGKLPAINIAEVKKGWTLMSPDLTSAVGPWGISYAANITSDDTGIGAWKEEQFVKAIREGKLKGLDGTRPLLPPMPWFVYKNLNDKDLKAIFAFLKTTTAVENIVPLPKQL